MTTLKTGCVPNSLDSNTVGLRYAEESCPGQLAAVPVWRGLDPNSFADFSASYSMVSRDTINARRQIQKGTIADVDATFGINQDLTMDGLGDLLQGFFFATARQRPTTTTIDGASVTPISTISTSGITLSNNTPGFAVNQLILMSGFSNSANNGLKQITGVTTANGLTAVALNSTTALVAETPPSTAKIEVVGMTAVNAKIEISGQYLKLTLPVAIPAIAGEWIYIPKKGEISDAVGTSTAYGFANNGGYARIHHITSSSVAYLDKWSWDAVAETLTTPAALVFPTTIRNESDPSLIVQRSYQFERTLGSDNDGVQSEYSVGAVANELTLNVQSAEKVTVDIGYVSMYNETRSGATGVKAGTRPDITYGRSAVNGTTDLHSLNMAIIQSGVTLRSSSLFNYATEMSFTINNNVNARKALGKLGAISMNAGNFEVGGSVTAYLTDMRAVAAIRNNASITIDALFQRDNKAQVWDIPLLTLTNGEIAVAKDEAITIPLDINGAESEFGFTMQYCQFAWVPTLTY